MEQDEMTEQEFYDSIMSEGDEAMRLYEEACKRNNDRILKVIGSQIGPGFLKDLKEIIEYSDVHDMHKLVDSPRGQFQQAWNAGCITGMWVEQYTDGEDSYHGYLWVKLKQGMWIELKFAN